MNNNDDSCFIAKVRTKSHKKNRSPRPLLVSEKYKGHADMMAIQAYFSSSNKRDYKVGGFSGPM